LTHANDVIEATPEAEEQTGPRNKATLWSLEKLKQRAVDISNGHGADLDGDEELNEILDIMSDCLRELDTDEDSEGISELDVFRAVLRHECLVDKLVSEEDTGLSFYGEFHGSGDSGNYEVETGNDIVDKFLELMLDKHVNFDWYNNEGGGGDITWDVQTDKVIINGHYYVQESVDEMVEEEF
jgi:hypothetical protein